MPIVLRRKVAHTVAIALDVSYEDYYHSLMEQIPDEMVCFGKMKWYGGDTVHAHELVESKGRDRSFIKVICFNQ